MDELERQPEPLRAALLVHHAGHVGGDDVLGAGLRVVADASPEDEPLALEFAVPPAPPYPPGANPRQPPGPRLPRVAPVSDSGVARCLR